MRLFRIQRLSVLAIFLTSLGSVIWSSHAIAETDQSTSARAVLGRELARAWCTQCHIVGSQNLGSAQSDVPTFHQIANRSGQSVQRIANFLIDPHPPMPNLHLSRQEMRDLATYILSLKQPVGD